MKPVRLSEKFKPHRYQENFLTDALDKIKDGEQGKWHLYSSPTGTGKSVMQLALLSAAPGGLLITPRLEIINGMLDKCGHDTSTWSEAQTIQVASEHGIYTPIRLRNILAKGWLTDEPRYLVVDECHHDLAQSYQDIAMYLNGITKVGLTATPFRGTPKQTSAFLAQWGDELNVILNVPQAIEQGYCALPTPEVWALMDDDKFDIVNGEFQQKQVDEGIREIAGAIVKKSTAFYDSKLGVWDRPTMVSVPSRDTARMLANEFDLYDIPTRVITGETSYSTRQGIFKQCIDRTHALIQINVVSEGVDLPIRRLIDCAPTISPVKWMQQIGRIMRPTRVREHPPEYYTICRNLERHCYLMEGAFPDRKIVEVQTAFDKIKPSQRSSTVRVLGTEGLTRFISTPVKLKNGLTVFTYHLNYQTKYQRSEYFVIVHPNTTEVMQFIKTSTIGEDGTIQWGKWKPTATLPPTDGFTSVKKKDQASEAQMAVWKKCADMKGLAVDQEPLNNRTIQILFVLLNTNLRM